MPVRYQCPLSEVVWQCLNAGHGAPIRCQCASNVGHFYRHKASRGMDMLLDYSMYYAASAASVTQPPVESEAYHLRWSSTS